MCGWYFTSNFFLQIFISNFIYIYIFITIFFILSSCYILYAPFLSCAMKPSMFSCLKIIIRKYQNKNQCMILYLSIMNHHIILFFNSNSKRIRLPEHDGLIYFCFSMPRSFVSSREYFHSYLVALPMPEPNFAKSK